MKKELSGERREEVRVPMLEVGPVAFRVVGDGEVDLMAIVLPSPPRCRSVGRSSSAVSRHSRGSRRRRTLIIETRRVPEGPTPFRTLHTGKRQKGKKCVKLCSKKGFLAT